MDVVESVSDVEATRREIRERYLEIAVGMPVFSVDSIDQVNAVMTSLLSRTREITIRSQVNNMQFELPMKFIGEIYFILHGKHVHIGFIHTRAVCLTEYIDG